MGLRKLPATTKRVSLKTEPDINAKIRENTIKRLNLYKDCDKEVISDQIDRLNYEWDTERFLEANAAAVVLLSTYLGLRSSKCWFLLTGTVGYYLLQHALQGWCPPVPAIRKMGIRTSEEINKEIQAFKILRGDFLNRTSDMNEIINAIEKQ